MERPRSSPLKKFSAKKRVMKPKTAAERLAKGD
jgi:hypothetical protein